MALSTRNSRRCFDFDVLDEISIKKRDITDRICALSRVGFCDYFCGF
jgi:hypothetical protein